MHTQNFKQDTVYGPIEHIFISLISLSQRTHDKNVIKLNEKNEMK